MNLIKLKRNCEILKKKLKTLKELNLIIFLLLMR